MKKQVYRIGDEVKILSPEIFIRCGYPLTIKDVINKVECQTRSEIVKAIEKISIPSWREEKKLVNDIANILSRYYLRTINFGGSKREIFTTYNDTYKDKIAIVKNKRVVKTGVRQEGWSNYEDNEYDPPYLSNVKTHIILTLGVTDGCFEKLIDIEECHVEKMM